MIAPREESLLGRLAGPALWGLAAGLLVAYLTWGRPARWIEQIELRGIDAHFLRRGPLPATMPIVVVAIDEATAHAPGFGEPGIMPRARYADLVRRLKQAGARLVVFDLLFTTPADPAQDADLASALADAGNVVLALTAYKAPPSQPEELWIERSAAPGPAEPEPTDSAPPNQSQPLNLPRSVPNAWTVADVPHAIVPRLPGAEQAEVPLPALAQACRRAGAVDIDPDSDGRYRRAYLLVRYGRQVLPSLALAAALQLQREQGQGLAFRDDRPLTPAGVPMPTNDAGALMVNFLGDRSALPEFSMEAVLRGQVPADQLRGAVVFVGSTLRGGGDQRPNPYSADFYGVHLNAQLLHSLLSGSFIRSLSGRSALLLVILAALAGALIGGLLPPLLALAAVFAVSLVWVTGSHIVFVRRGLLLPLAAPLLGVAAGYVLGATRRLLLAQSRAAFMRAAFDRFGVPELAQRLGCGQDDAALFYGRRMQVAVLFCDLRNFTGLAERLEVREVMALLNLFFDRVDSIIREHGGSIDKYIGDCVMALFVDDAEQGEHARDAVRTGLAILRELNLLREEWLFSGADEEPRVNMGIHAGLVVLGCVGSRRRLQYTAIGAAVNAASEMEKLCAATGAQMLISDAVYERARDLVTARQVDRALIPERLADLAVYEVLGPGVPRAPQASSSGSNGSA